MALVEVGEGVELGGRGVLEEGFDLGLQGRLVGLDGEKVIGPGRGDGGGDVRIAGDGIDGDDGPFEGAARRQALEESGMALVSVDFSSTASCPSTSRAEVAKADTRWSGPWPMLRLWLRRAVLPSMAIRSGRSGQTSRTQALKQAENRPGSIRFISSVSQRAPGTP